MKSVAVAAVVLLGCYTLSTQACSNIVIKAQDGATLVGRTLEFGPDLKSRVMTSPRGRQFTSPSPAGASGLSWTSQYGYVYLNFFGQNNAVDGLNEKGLSFGFLYLPGYTQYPTVPAGKANQALSYLYVGDWILGNFATVEEVTAALRKSYVFAQAKDFGSHKNIIFPLHIIVTDSSGKSATIEFNRGKIKIYKNANGVMTNSPTYPWQRNNQLNYVNLTPNTPQNAAFVINGISYTGTGQGSGAVGLPGDYTPPSRFTKLTFLSMHVAPSQNAMVALNTAQHILNNVDIPKGAVRGAAGENTPPDTTQWTVFKDLTHQVLYFSTYQNTTLQKIDLKKLNLSKGAQVKSMPIVSAQIIVDATEKLNASAQSASSGSE